MVQKSFGIYDEGDKGNSIFIEQGNNYVTVWRQDQHGRKTALELFDVPLTGFSDSYEEILSASRILNQEFSVVNCVLATPGAIIVPAEIYNPALGESALKLQFGLEGEVDYFKQEVKDKIVVAVYPAELLNKLSTYSVNIVHKYGLLLQNPQSEPTSARLCFYSKQFIFELHKEGALQLLRHFDFIEPADALYYILNVFKQLGIEPASISVSAAGLLDTSSALYNLLYQYLPDFSLETGEGDFPDESGFRNYPSHYFSTFSYREL